MQIRMAITQARSCMSMITMHEQAVEDFRKRISNYEEVYEPIMDRNLHYIKLIDM